MRLELPYPPSANAYWRQWKGRTLVSREARAYKMRVGTLCTSLRVQPIDGPVVVTVSVYRPARRGDLDNTLKVLLDSLRGFAFHDDAQVVELHASRGDDKANPRAVVTIEAVSP